MAKKDDTLMDELTADNEESKGSKILSLLIGILIFAIILGAFIVCIKLDIGNLGSKVLRPAIKDIPVLNMILPEASAEDLATENDYPYSSLPEAMKAIRELEAKLKLLEEGSGTDSTTINELQKEVARLRVFEENQQAFIEREKEFDTNVVFNEKAPELNEYQAFYEEINEENAAEIYRQVIEQLAIDKQIVDQAERFAKMEPASAAAAMEIMTGDLDLVCNLLKSMKIANSSAIMQEMDPNFLAKITKKLSIME